MKNESPSDVKMQGPWFSHFRPSHFSAVEQRQPCAAEPKRPNIRFYINADVMARASLAAETRTHYKRNRGIDIPLAPQPFHNPRQFGA